MGRLKHDPVADAVMAVVSYPSGPVARALYGFRRLTPPRRGLLLRLYRSKRGGWLWGSDLSVVHRRMATVMEIETGLIVWKPPPDASDKRAEWQLCLTKAGYILAADIAAKETR